MTALAPMQNSAKYIAELFTKIEYDPRLAIADSEFSRDNNIYHFSIAPLVTDTDNYWIKWGGTFDNPTSKWVRIFLGLFLIKVDGSADMLITDNSYWIDETNNKCYMNLDRAPYLYFSAYAAVYDNYDSTFATAPKDENNPSDIYYSGVPAPAIMDTPTFKTKLSDAISGITVYNSFQIELINSDGKFDGLDILDFFNVPIVVSKTTENAQTLEEFNQVRYGVVSDTPLNFSSLSVKAEDQLYSLDKEVCRTFSILDYLNIGDNEGKIIPIAWGDVYHVELFEVNKDTADPPEWIEYIALDPNYITDADAVYDSDGNSLTFSFDSSTGILRVTELDEDGEVIEGESADVTGSTDNAMGQIIVDILDDIENLSYVSDVWDTTETDDYISYCSDIAFYFAGGTTKKLVSEVLKNDIAFLIQKNNGLLTIRRWGKNYDTFYIPSWLATDEPEKNFSDAYKYFCSSVRILYQKFYKDNEYNLNYFDDSEELTIFGNYKKSFIAEFKTELTESADIEDLSERILTRFGTVRETLKIGFGVDTYQVNLLDTIKFEGEINDRDFSEYSRWIVKAVDPGQDQIEMEGDEITYVLTFDGKDATFDDLLVEVKI